MTHKRQLVSLPKIVVHTSYCDAIRVSGSLWNLTLTFQHASVHTYWEEVCIKTVCGKIWEWSRLEVIHTDITPIIYHPLESNIIISLTPNPSCKHKLFRLKKMTTLYKNLPNLRAFVQKIHAHQQESFRGKDSCWCVCIQLHKENNVAILVLLFYTHSEGLLYTHTHTPTQGSNPLC